jgi:hypothetical protein
VDLTISDDEKDVVEVGATTVVNDVDHLLENGVEIGGAWEPNLLERLTIEMEDALGTEDLGVWVVAIEGEAMVDGVLTHKARDTSETIDWEGLIVVIGFKDRANRAYGLFILIHRSKIMKRVRDRVLTIWCCIIDCNT